VTPSHDNGLKTSAFSDQSHIIKSRINEHRSRLFEALGGFTKIADTAQAHIDKKLNKRETSKETRHHGKNVSVELTAVELMHQQSINSVQPVTRDIDYGQKSGNKSSL
jgi:threonine dehydrogenase-like Zn-dependent dehydrogenase